MRRTGIGSGTLLSAVEYGLPLPCRHQRRYAKRLSQTLADLSTLRSRPAEAEPARGATRGDDVCRMTPDTERRDSSRSNGGDIVRLSLSFV